VISEWFRRRLVAKGVTEWKLLVISNFVDTDFVEPRDRLNSFSKEQELDEKFVVLYAGNIGLSQNFENILSAAGRLNHLEDLCFLIVGAGTRRSWLEGKLSQNNLLNVRLLPYQPKSTVPDVYASSDVCLVPLKGGTAQQTFPSKIYTIMAAGRPAIVAADADSELSWVAKESGCGWAVPPDNDEALAKAIELAYQQRSSLKQKGELGRKYVVQHHSRQVIARQYDRLIREIVRGR
jgi:colanic acid biosynthesis glycosyl transferase WcaI